MAKSDVSFQSKVITTVNELDFKLADQPNRPLEERVLMADPEYFDIEYVINPHMVGNIGSVSKEKAREQWSALRAAYLSIGFPVEVLQGVPGLPDLVFTANQSFPGQLPSGQWVAVLSEMRSAERKAEVALIEEWYLGRGATCVPTNPGVSFEGMGDAAWVPGRRVIIGGHGFRTDAAVYHQLSALFQVPVISLRLASDTYYHLDTALSMLDDTTALYVKEAFDAEGVALLNSLFDRLAEVPADEAQHKLACNGHCPDRQHFIVQRGASKTNQIVESLGYRVIEADTTEFLKSGGSVYCMKLMVP